MGKAGTLGQPKAYYGSRGRGWEERSNAVAPALNFIYSCPGCGQSCRLGNSPALGLERSVCPKFALPDTG